MKQLRKSMTLFWLVTVFCMLSVFHVSAASNVPANVTKLTAKEASETSITLSWKKAKNASGYTIYQVNNTTGALKKVGTTTKLTYTISKLKLGQTYTYQVFSYKKVKTKTYASEKGSPKASVKLDVLTPAKAAGLKVATYGDGQVNLKWSTAKNATGYYLYQYDEENKSYKKIASTTSKTYTVKKLKAGEKCRFYIAAYRKKNGIEKIGKASDILTVTAKTYSKSTKAVIGKRHIATLKTDASATIVDTKKTTKLKKGTKIYSTSRSTSGTVTAYMQNGTKIKISASKLKYGNIQTTRTAYSKAVLEAFVNEKGYTSSTNRLIWINQYTMTTNIFKNVKGTWKLERRCVCVVGKDGATPSSSTKTYKLRVQDYAYGGPRVYFTYRIKDGAPYGNSFHRRVDSITQGAASHGCVRLGDADLNYLVANCKLGTTVVSF